MPLIVPEKEMKKEPGYMTLAQLIAHLARIALTTDALSDADLAELARAVAVEQAFRAQLVELGRREIARKATAARWGDVKAMAKEVVAAYDAGQADKRRRKKQ
jgi:hypothetical protein